jgi:hypothetical protein
MWKPLPITDFSGGQHDEFDSCPPNYCQRLRNFLLDAAGKPYQRNGTTLFSVQLPTAERISSLKLFRDPAYPADYSSKRMFAYSHHKLYYSQQQISEGNFQVVTSWTEALATDNATSIGANLQLDARAKMQFVDNHVYLSFQTNNAYSAGWQTHPKIRKLLPNPALNSGAGGYVAMNLGLPAANLGTSPLTPSGTTGTQGVYQYQFVLEHSYSINGVQYAVQGTPSRIFETNAYPMTGTNTNQVAIAGLVWPVNATNGDIWPVTQAGTANMIGTLKCQIYRTAINQSTLQFVDAIVYPATTYTDALADSELAFAIYTADGTAAYDECPPCKLHHVVGDFSYFGGFDISIGSSTFPSGFCGIIQSSPGVLSSAPQSFTIETADHPTALESIDLYPIVFTLHGCYRLEGSIDQYGNGDPVLRVISEKVGAVNQAAVTKTDRGLLFASLDGVYFTDGFSITKFTDHQNKAYRSWFYSDPSNTSQAIISSAAYHLPTQKFFLSTCSSRYISPAGTIPNTINTVDLRSATKNNGNAAVGDIVGSPDYSGTSSTGLRLNPMCMEVLQDTLLIGDNNGYVLSMRIQPAQPADVRQFDVGSDVSAAPSNWLDMPVIWDWVSAVYDFGNRFAKKWVMRMTASFKFAMVNWSPNPTGAVIPNSVYAQITSYDDMGFTGIDTSNGTGVPLSDNGQPLAIVQDSNIPLYQRVWTVTRKFVKGSIRCTFKQVRIAKSNCILYSSAPNGTQVYSEVAALHLGLTLQLFGSSFIATWPLDANNKSDVLGQTIYLSNDGYTNGYYIAAASTDTLTVLDPNGTFPVNGAYQWEIWGYSKTQSFCGLDSMTMYYLDVPGRQHMAASTDAGKNS